ncbi:MAG: hypothetical protein IKD62_08070, partial [Oscillospiraceae bacterium]|nr:hypothetical protein [Oscillospiraceae bacterium]
LHTGALVIDPAPLTVETGSASKPYNPEDPTPLTCAVATIDGLVNNETATIKATGSQTEIGVSDNTYEITWGTAKETNYVIESEKIGELEVFDASVTVDVSADKAVEFYYNGDVQEQELRFVLSTESDSFDLNTIQYVGSEDLTLTTEKDQVILKTTLKGKEVGDYTVKLSTGDLICTDENYVVTFDIHGDLTLRILPIPVTVHVVPNREQRIYTGEEITIPTIALIDIDQEFGAAYTEDKYVFNGPETIKGTKIGNYTETIAPEMFENKDGNYEVEFVIEKDPTASLYIGQPIVGIELTANVFETVYNGSEHTLTVLKDGSVKLDGVKQDAPAFTVTHAETFDGEPFEVDLSKITLRKATSVSGTAAGLYDPRDFANYLHYADNTYRVEFIIVGYVTLDVQPIEARLVIDNVETYYTVDKSASYTAHYEGLPAGDEGPDYTLISADPDAKVGEYPITVEGAKDENVFYDDNHIITFVPGKLTVKPLPITYTAAFANVKVAYTGETQTAGGIDCSVSTDIEGADVSLFDIESITNYADLESIAYIDVKDINTYLITVDDASKYEGTDPNFDVTMVFVDGSVEVTDELINLGRLELIDAEYTYDGEFHAVEYRLENPDNYTITGLPITYSGAQADGMEVYETSADGIKNAGSYTASPGDPREADIKILDKNGVDVSGICQFSSVTNATLVIKPMPVTVKIWGNRTQMNNYRYNGSAPIVTGSGYTAEVVDANGNPTDLYVADHLSNEYMLYDGGTTDPHVSGRGINQTYWYGMTARRFSNVNQNFTVTFKIMRDGCLKVVNKNRINYISWQMDNLTVEYNGQDQTFVPSLIDAFGDPVKPQAGDTEVFKATDGKLYYVTFATTPNYEPLTKSAPGTYYGRISNIHFSKIEDQDGFIVNAAGMSLDDVSLNCTATSVQSYSSDTKYGGVFKINKIHLKVRINDDIHKEYAEPDPDRSTWITILEGQLKPGDKIEEILNITREPGENVGKYPIRVSLASSGWDWGGWERPVEKGYQDVSIRRVPEEEVNPWQPSTGSSSYELEIEDVNTTKYLEITPIPLIITANDDSKEYADPHNPDPTFTARVEGLIGSEYLPENFYSIWRDPGEQIGDYPIRLARDENFVDIIPEDPMIPIDEPIIVDPIYPPIEEVKRDHEDVAMKSAPSVVYGGGDEEERPENPGIPIPFERPYISTGGGSGYFWSGNYVIKLVNGNFNIYGDKLEDPDDPPTPPDTPPTPPVDPPTPPDNPPTPPTPPDNPNPPAEITSDPTPPVTEEIIEEAPPTAGLGNRAWALLNLLCAIATVITGILMLVTYFRNKDEDEEEEEAVPYAKAQVQDKDEEEEKKRKKSKFLGLIPAIGAVIAFILTEDMRLPMIFIDKWTPLMVVILVVGLVLALVTRNRDDEDEDEDEGHQINSVADPAAAN